MPPLRIVEARDVVEQRRTRRGARGPEGLVDELDLEGGEKAVGQPDVPGVGAPTPAADKRVADEERLVVPARIPAATV